MIIFMKNVMMSDRVSDRTLPRASSQISVFAFHTLYLSAALHSIWIYLNSSILRVDVDDKITDQWFCYFYTWSLLIITMRWSNSWFVSMIQFWHIFSINCRVTKKSDWHRPKISKTKDTTRSHKKGKTDLHIFWRTKIWLVQWSFTRWPISFVRIFKLKIWI